jgi:release factor glutamine methyltransferase
MAATQSVLTVPLPLPPREASILLAHVLGKSREWVIAHPEAELTPEQHERFTALAEQATNGVPLPYLLGHWEFFGLDFIVTPDVLIPRPETELLVERALQNPNLENPKAQKPKTRGERSRTSPFLDVGTGSGIIAVTLAVKLPNVEIVAADISPAALAVAKANAEKHNVANRITFVESDLLSSFIIRHSSFAIVAANLPYVPSADLDSLPVAKHEPRLALDGGPDGLDYIRRLLADAPRAVAPGGRILLEIEYRQGATVAALAHEAFPDARVEVHQDLAGLDRVVEIEVDK